MVAALLLPMLAGVRHSGWQSLRSSWPNLRTMLWTVLAALLMVANLVIYNLLFGAGTLSTSGNRIGRYVGEDAWTVSGWGERLVGLLQAVALAVGSRTSEVEAESWRCSRRSCSWRSGWRCSGCGSPPAEVAGCRCSRPSR